MAVLYDHRMAVQLKVGDKAPDFELVDQTGKKVKLASFRKRRVMVYFYPKADTPGCTTQACGLRDILGDVGDTAVLGISPDPPAKQAKFDQKYGLGFPLLADEDHAVAESFGVWAEKSMYGRTYMGIVRSAFLVDEKGTLSKVWYKISPKDTPKTLMAALTA
jgi:thioredoxin-dependent peroxiredoxin